VKHNYKEAKMRAITVFILIGITFLFLSAVSGLAQEQASNPPKNQTPSQLQQEFPEEALPPVDLDSDIQWLWGEVLSGDFQKNELVIKYVDYDTDIEKEVVVMVSDKTTYENVKSLLEIKPRDMVSIDYTVDSQGRNIAKNISVEKPEAGEVE